MFLLDKKSLRDGEKFEGTSYLVNYKGKLANNGSYFYTLYLKCVDGSIINGYLFNVDKLDISSLLLDKLKRKVVTIKGFCREFNSYKSLNIIEIDICGEQVPIRKFLGELKESRESLIFINECFEKLGFSADVDKSHFCTTGFLDICGGREGGYSVLFSRVLGICMDSIKQFSEDNKILFCRVYLSVLNNYFEYLKKVEDLDILSNVSVFNILNSVFMTTESSTEINIIMDTLMSLANLSEPQHLFSHLIVSSYKCVKEQLDLSIKNDELPFGGSCKVGDLTLIKY